MIATGFGVLNRIVIVLLRYALHADFFAIFINYMNLINFFAASCTGYVCLMRMGK
jgi:hypothetical protein